LECGVKNNVIGVVFDHYRWNSNFLNPFFFHCFIRKGQSNTEFSACIAICPNCCIISDYCSRNDPNQLCQNIINPTAILGGDICHIHRLEDEKYHINDNYRYVIVVFIELSNKHFITYLINK